MLAWNPGGLALYAGLDDWPAKQRNLARYFFLRPTAGAVGCGTSCRSRWSRRS
ncbi:MmyB family transcriptional regulator [Streptomyces sp. NPDC001937]